MGGSEAFTVSYENLAKWQLLPLYRPYPVSHFYRFTANTQFCHSAGVKYLEVGVRTEARAKAAWAMAAAMAVAMAVAMAAAARVMAAAAKKS